MSLAESGGQEGSKGAARGTSARCSRKSWRETEGTVQNGDFWPHTLEHLRGLASRRLTQHTHVLATGRLALNLVHRISTTELVSEGQCIRLKLPLGLYLEYSIIDNSARNV